MRDSLVSVAAIVLSVGILACGGPSKKDAASTAKPVDGNAVNGEPGGNSAVETPAGPVGYATPGNAACMLHQEAGGHYSCLSGADGQCFHYGAVCQPKDVCTIEIASATYKECKTFTEGACVEFLAECKPKRTCLYDASQRRYRSCPTPKLGGCTAFGAPCDPS